MTGATLVLTPVEIVNVLVAAAPDGVTLAGAKLHAAFAGSPVHAKLTGCANPPEGVVVTVTVSLPLCPRVRDEGFTLTVNEAVACTVSDNALDTEAGSVASPPYDAVMA